MPLVRVSLQQGRSKEEKRAIVDAIYGAMRETINIPENDRFIFLDERAAENVFVDPTYLSEGRSADALVIEITLRAGRLDEMKRDLYRRLAERLGAAAGVRAADVMVVLRENSLADWSFSGGVAQYLG